MATLIRVRDGSGDYGSRVEALEWNDDRTLKGIVGNRPIVGCSLLVGSMTARSYSYQDYWLTTLVSEILSEKPGEIRFMTVNGSEYLFEYDGEIPEFKEAAKLTI